MAYLRHTIGHVTDHSSQLLYACVEYNNTLYQGQEHAYEEVMGHFDCDAISTLHCGCRLRGSPPELIVGLNAH